MWVPLFVIFALEYKRLVVGIDKILLPYQRLRLVKLRDLLFR